MKIMMEAKERILMFKNWCFKTSLKDKFLGVKNYFLNASLKKRALFLVILIGIGVLVRQIVVSAQVKKVTYETSKAEKGALITFVSASGTITSGNSTSITTKISGEVKTVYVTNGDTVAKGQKIADVTPDEYASQRETAAWVTYLDAQEAVKTAEKNKMDADIEMWEDRQAILDAEEEVKDKNLGKINPDTDELYNLSEQTVVDKTLDQARKAFEEAELKYKNADSEVQAAKAKVSSTLRDYQENSSTIYAPTAGVISDLTLAPGIVINASSTTSSSTGATIISSQTVGKISSTNGQLIATINLAEIDVINVKANQKVSIVLDAYPDKTFTGKVLAVSTAGSVSSGVTSYPVSILLDPISVEIYPNMAVNAEIIISIKDEVVLVPTTAITTINDQSIIQVKKDNEITAVQVEVGDSNDSQTEIISGINEGDEVVTSIISSESETESDSTSPFSGMGGGSNVRIEGGGPPGGF